MFACSNLNPRRSDRSELPWLLLSGIPSARPFGRKRAVVIRHWDERPNVKAARLRLSFRVGAIIHR